MPQNTPPPGWYQDPTGVGEGRYWDGTSWTQSVSRAGQIVDVPMEPGRADLPPIPGSELTAPPVATPTTVTVEAPKRSAFGAIVGVIGIILLVVVIVAIVSNSDDSSNDESPPATSPATTAAPADDG